MHLNTFEWKAKPPLVPRHNGQQIVLDFGKFQMSIINDGYGKEQGLLEIQTYKVDNETGDISPIELMGITGEHDTVKGFLNENEVNGIIHKLYWLTGERPKQIFNW